MRKSDPTGRRLTEDGATETVVNWIDETSEEAASRDFPATQNREKRARSSLDEYANKAPFPRLDEVAATGSGSSTTAPGTTSGVFGLANRRGGRCPTVPP
jgi:hypothetical protein